MGGLFDDSIDPAMPRLARAYAKRAGLTFVGVSRVRGLLDMVAVAQFRDACGAVYSRTLEDLRDVPATPTQSRAAAVVVDRRTLSLF